MSSTRRTNLKSLDVIQITKIIPHRYPFLLIDKIIDLDFENKKIIGQKNVTINEPFFQGHFPEIPLMPGVLVLEALAQVGGLLLEILVSGSETKLPVLLNINQAKFRLPVKPGDVLMLHCEALHHSSKGGKVEAKALVDNKVVVEASIAFCFVEKKAISE